jgi:NitT/TauT family transport system substrate-binding protein
MTEAPMFDPSVRKTVIGRLRSHAKLALIAIGLLWLLYLACGDRRQRAGSETLRVVIAPFLSHAPLFIAQEEGYFAEQGLEVEFVKMISSGQAVPALTQGDVDIIAGALRINLLNAMVRGGEIGFVAGEGHIAPEGCVTHALMARPELAASGELDDPARLKGLRIATNPSVYTGYFLEKLLNTAGLTFADIEVENIPYPARPEALQKGTVDLATSAEPWITRMLQAGQAVVWMPFRDVIPGFQLAVIIYGPTLLEQNPDAGRRFMVAYLKAVQQYNQGKSARNLEILAKHTGLDEELLTSCCWPEIRSDGTINCQSILSFQRWAIAKGLLDRLVPEERFWDPIFIEHARQVLDIQAR